MTVYIVEGRSYEVSWPVAVHVNRELAEYHAKMAEAVSLELSKHKETEFRGSNPHDPYWDVYCEPHPIAYHVEERQLTISEVRG